MNEFLHKRGWKVVKNFPQDGSARRYARVTRNDRAAILMECADPDAPGNSISDFVRIGEWLSSIGLSAPEIYEVEGSHVLLEDFGDTSFKTAIERGAGAKELYTLAHDVMEAFGAQDCPLELPNFYDSRVYDGRRFLVEWYLPFIGHDESQNELMAGYLSAWDEIERALPETPKGFLHIDYHLENLMWLPDEQGTKRCGILDFQGAMIGPKAYDLGNLLEDARVDVPQKIRDEILAGYDDAFRASYRVYTTLFHCRLMGQFIKMAAEDGKEQYLQYLPRISHYIARAMENPILAPLNTFFNELRLDFSDIKRLNADEIRTYISKIKLAS